MEIRVSGHQIETGEALQAHVSDRMNAIADKYFSRAIGAHATFGKGPHDSFQCDIVAHVMQGLVLKGHGQAQDAHVAFEGAADRIEKQLRRYMRRLKDRNNGNGAQLVTIETIEDNASYVVFDGGTDDEDAGDAPAIIAETRVDIPTSSVCAAVRQQQDRVAQHGLSSPRRHDRVGRAALADNRAGFSLPFGLRAAPNKARKPDGGGQPSPLKRTNANRMTRVASPCGHADLTRPMNLSSLLYPATVRANVQLDAKKALFPYVGELAARSLGLDAGEVSEALLERERLGSTGFGRGIALPHAKMADLNGVRGMFLQLARPIDFQAVDGLPVDLLFVLLSPLDAGADHLKALAGVSRMLRNDSIAERLRGAKNDEALYAMLVDAEARDAA